MSEEIQRALGRIEGELKGMRRTQNAHGAKLESIDKRVTDTQVKAAKNGALSGTLMVGFIELLKASFHS